MEDESATYRDAYLLLSNRYDVPEEVAAVYVKRWRIEVFYRTYYATQGGNVIKKAPKKPYPTAKWLDTYSTPVIGFAVTGNKSKFILTQLVIGFQGSSKNFGLRIHFYGCGTGIIHQ
ncbi:hypothetical protein L9W92_10840 [Pelotomaculum terephthalicicum JT]|uniref:hypothetical protein n=1 Tax=Pelotomaculum TaxID=191373 RepID=UPI001F040D93|nr:MULTISPECIES: hypothetical protein [Pelotomaculum]MCG9968549.1 hypothetical protein [Pelotomaculum terephthalicicum JT]